MTTWFLSEDMQAEWWSWLQEHRGTLEAMSIRVAEIEGFVKERLERMIYRLRQEIEACEFAASFPKRLREAA